MATGKWFGTAAKNQWSATAANRIDWVGDTIKVSLHSSTYTPDQDNHDFFSDITNEVTGTNYTAGGTTLAGKSLLYDTGTNEIRLDANDASWASATITGIRYAVVYKDTGSAATSPLVGWVDFSSDQSVTSGTFTISWDSSGVMKGVVS